MSILSTLTGDVNDRLIEFAPDSYYVQKTTVSESATSNGKGCFLSTDVAHLGFCLRPKSSISDYWLSHRVKERTGGHFEMWLEK